MYDMTKLNRRYFDIKLKNGKCLNVEPPKLKVLKKIMSLSKVDDKQNMNDNDMGNLTLGVSLALSKNKQNYNVSVEWLDENTNIDELLDFLQNYFNWVNEIQNSKN